MLRKPPILIPNANESDFMITNNNAASFVEEMPKIPMQQEEVSGEIGT